MKPGLTTIFIENHLLFCGKQVSLPLSYELFGQPLHSAPVVLLNHALTGNSTVGGENGWWKKAVGAGKPIDTEKYTILCFNIPGNGYDGFLIENYEDFTAKDIASLFLKGLELLGLNEILAVVGGSVGGAIGWEMLVLNPNLAQKFIPLATDFKTTDWLNAQCLVQKTLLESTEKPLQKARMHAMLCYRTPESLNLRFQGKYHMDNKILNSQDWLIYHGEALSNRFSLEAYRLMNHLLMTISADEDSLTEISAEIHLVAVDTDLFFPAFETRKCYGDLIKTKKNVHYHEIQSIHGHDAFLMEYEQLNRILEISLTDNH